LELASLYDALEYQFQDLPKHPYIKKRMKEFMPTHKREKVMGLYLQGPVAGSFKCGAMEVELCDRTCKAMMDHKMGGQVCVYVYVYVYVCVCVHRNMYTYL
jgi:hypothetical protein